MITTLCSNTHPTPTVQKMLRGNRGGNPVFGTTSAQRLKEALGHAEVAMKSESWTPGFLAPRAREI